METPHEFNERVWRFQTSSVPNEPVFTTHPCLKDKVTPGTGALRPFHGDTVAYLLDDQARALVGAVAHKLHACLGGSLSLPLPLEMAHVTLHDLHASPDRQQVWPSVEASAARAAELVGRARETGPIRVLCTTVFNLVNTSVVVGLKAADEQEQRKLLTTRGVFDQIVPSGPFTPHITVAYYRPDPPAQLVPDTLRDVLRRLSGSVSDHPITLAPEHLHAMRFDSMGRYWVADQ